MLYIIILIIANVPHCATITSTVQTATHLTNQNTYIITSYCTLNNYIYKTQIATIFFLTLKTFYTYVENQNQQVAGNTERRIFKT